MPAPRRPPVKPATMVLTALGGVAAGVLIFLVVLSLTGSRSNEQAQTATFRVGSAERLAASVARDGPLLFQDLLNRSRDIYVQHLGEDDWRAFEAHAPGGSRRCVLLWQRDGSRFVDPCTSRTFPADGTGLTAYAATVDKKGMLVVDLSREPAPTTTPAP